VGGGVQLVPFGTAATNRHIVPAPGDYDDGDMGGMNGTGNRSTRRKPAPVPLRPPQTPHAVRTLNPGRSCGKPATNRLNYGTDHPVFNLAVVFKSIKLWWVGYVARMKKKIRKKFVGRKCHGKLRLEKQNRRLEGNIKVDLMFTGLFM
jgi:hypothetical protein